ISMDSSGDSLHKRGYKTVSGVAPLSEVLASGILKLSGWDGKSELYDGMCGSGTLLTEAFLLSKNTPCGKYRQKFCFQQWRNFDGDKWKEIKDESKRIESDNVARISGGDSHPYAIEDAKMNIAAGDKALAKGDFETAKKSYEAALAAMPKDETAINNLKKVAEKEEESKNAEAAAKAAEEAKVAAEAEKAKKDEFDKLVADGDKALKSEDFDEAVKQYEEAAKLMPDQTSVKTKLSIVAETKKKREAAALVEEEAKKKAEESKKEAADIEKASRANEKEQAKAEKEKALEEEKAAKEAADKKEADELAAKDDAKRKAEEAKKVEETKAAEKKEKIKEEPKKEEKKPEPKKEVVKKSVPKPPVKKPAVAVSKPKATAGTAAAIAKKEEHAEKKKELHATAKKVTKPKDKHNDIHAKLDQAAAAQNPKTTSIHEHHDWNMNQPGVHEEIAKEYPIGVTEEVYMKGNKEILERVVVKDGMGSIYWRVKHPWGGVYYFKNANVSISSVEFDLFTTIKDDEGNVIEPYHIDRVNDH
ncbi:hypothetical protein N9E62_02165, partial [Salibacteraceae bacterium]|nr:hypothetical protein [Salibacteraceae bacterium]